MVGITSTSRRHKGGRDYDRCGNRVSIFLNPQNFAITIGKPVHKSFKVIGHFLHVLVEG